MKTSFLTELLDFVSPRACAICGRRLPAGDLLLCPVCLLHLPLTNFAAEAYDNPMVRLFWGQFPIERAAALFFFTPQSDCSQLIYDLKYHRQPHLGQLLGNMIAHHFAQHHFFDGIDAIVPVPITRMRRWKRGYNQSEEIARGLHDETGIPVMRHVVKRISFNSSQTRKSIWERQQNVENVFRLQHAEHISGKHVLIVDDIVTTGATVRACAKELAKAGDVRISVLSIGYTKE